MEAVHEDRRLRVAARHQERGQKVTPTSRTAASSSKAAGRMRRRGTAESMMTLHPYVPVPGTQLGQWSYARVLCFLGQACGLLLGAQLSPLFRAPGGGTPLTGPYTRLAQKVLRERMITWVYFHPKSSFPKLQKRPILVHNLMIS